MKKFLAFLFALLVFVCITGTASADVLSINNDTLTLTGDAYYDSVTITNGGVLQVDGYLNLVVSDSIYVDEDSYIDGTAGGASGGAGGMGGAGADYPNDAGYGFHGTEGSGGGEPGGGGAPGSGWPSGGGGGTGGTSGSIVGDMTARYDYTIRGYGGGGGGGGAGGADLSDGVNGLSGSSGEPGGATVRLAAPSIDINGSIFVDGGSGGSGGNGAGGEYNILGLYSQGGGGGGGAGGGAGMIFLDGDNIDISYATLSAIGGDGGLGGSPGGDLASHGEDGWSGADGRIKIFYTDTFLDTGANYSYGTLHIEVVPIPSALWLIGSGLIGIVGIRRIFKG